MNLSIREVFVNYYKISFCNEFDLSQLEFYMDVSPEWWINSSKNESIVRKYICEKFEYDCYPKIITFGRQKIDLEKNYEFKSMLLDKLISGKFQFEFLPEDEDGLNPCHQISIANSLKFIQNPVKCCRHIHYLIQEVNKIIEYKRSENECKG